MKVFEFKPKNDAIAIGFEQRVAKWSMVMLNLPFVQLQHEAIACVQALVLLPSMAAGETKQFLVPTAARFDVLYANQWCELHSYSFGGRTPTDVPCEA
jgi:hypothetical protein